MNFLFCIISILSKEKVMKNRLKRLVTGVYWDFNVYQNGKPVVDLGKVAYIVDDFGNAILITNTAKQTLNTSLRD